jgi:hypothetical protein
MQWEPIKSLLSENGLDLKNSAYIEAMAKDNVKWWEQIALKRKLDKSHTVVLDDSEKNCEAASKAGFAVVQWKMNNVASVEKLSVVLQGMGYQPS